MLYHPVSTVLSNIQAPIENINPADPNSFCWKAKYK